MEDNGDDDFIIIPICMQKLVLFIGFIHSE